MKRKYSKIRGWVALVVLLTVAIGLATHTATGTYSAFGISQIAAICPLGALETLVTGAAPTWHVAVGLVLAIVFGLVFGKAFCSWICPTPWIQRLFGRGAKGKGAKVKGEIAGASEGEGADAGEAGARAEAEAEAVEAAIAGATAAATVAAEPFAETSAEPASIEKTPDGRLAPLGGKRDKVTFDTRHGVLLGALLSTAVFGFPVFCLVCPVGLTIATFIAIWHAFQFSEVTWGLLVFPAIIILEVVVLRRWCHTLCPLGALYSLMARGNRTFVPKVNTESCLRTKGADCHVCVDACPEELDPHTGKIPECTKCGICVERCPACAIDFAALLKAK